MSKFYNLIKESEKLKTNAKTTLVKEFSDDENIKTLFLLMLEKTEFTYNTKTIDKNANPKEVYGYDILTDGDLVRAIHWFLSLGMNKSKEMDSILLSVYMKCTDELKMVFEWVLDRQNPAKIGTSIVNKIWPKLIHEQYYIGGKPGTPDALERLDATGKKKVIQKKEDGCAFLPSYICKNVELRTRQGNDITKCFPSVVKKLKECYEETEKQGLSISDSPYVSYEAMLLNHDGTLMDRSKSNGLLNKAVKNKQYQKEIDEAVILVAWDIACLDTIEESDDKTFDMPVQTRYEYLLYLSTCANKVHKGFITPVETHFVDTVDEAREYVKQWIADGFEGGMIKDFDSPWKDGKYWWILKLKNEIEVEVRIVGYKPHSKNPNFIGSLIVESECGRMQTGVGSGLNDTNRPIELFEQYEGQITTVKCEKITKSKSKDTYALSLPRFVSDENDSLIIRCDKKVADTLEEMHEIEKMSKGVK